MAQHLSVKPFFLPNWDALQRTLELTLRLNERHHMNTDLRRFYKSWLFKKMLMMDWCNIDYIGQLEPFPGTYLSFENNVAAVLNAHTSNWNCNIAVFLIWLYHWLAFYNKHLSLMKHEADMHTNTCMYILNLSQIEESLEYVDNSNWIDGSHSSSFTSYQMNILHTFLVIEIILRLRGCLHDTTACYNV